MRGRSRFCATFPKTSSGDSIHCSAGGALQFQLKFEANELVKKAALVCGRSARGGGARRARTFARGTDQCALARYRGVMRAFDQLPVLQQMAGGEGAGAQ